MLCYVTPSPLVRTVDRIDLVDYIIRRTGQTIKRHLQTYEQETQQTYTYTLSVKNNNIIDNTSIMRRTPQAEAAV